MCSVDVYAKEYVPMPCDESSGGVIPIPSKSSKKALYSLGHKINFLDNWLQWFDGNYQNIIAIYKIKMSELFETILKPIPPKKVMIISTKSENNQGSRWRMVFF